MGCVIDFMCHPFSTLERKPVESSWNVMAQGDAREGNWRENWRIEWVASTLHTTSEHGVVSIITADAHTSAASSRLNWRTRLFKRTRPFRRKTKSGFCACAITFQTQSTYTLEGRRVVTIGGVEVAGTEKIFSSCLNSSPPDRPASSEQLHLLSALYTLS